ISHFGDQPKPPIAVDAQRTARPAALGGNAGLQTNGFSPQTAAGRTPTKARVLRRRKPPWHVPGCREDSQPLPKFSLDRRSLPGFGRLPPALAVCDAPNPLPL